MSLLWNWWSLSGRVTWLTLPLPRLISNFMFVMLHSLRVLLKKDSCQSILASSFPKSGFTWSWAETEWPPLTTTNPLSLYTHPSADLLSTLLCLTCQRGWGILPYPAFEHPALKHPTSPIISIASLTSSFVGKSPHPSPSSDLAISCLSLKT